MSYIPQWDHISRIMWERPKKTQSTESWKSIIADSAPPGVYTPNMSEEDCRRWKGKIVGTRSQRVQIELRKDSMVMVLGGSRGYKYKHYDIPENGCVHLAIAGSIIFSKDEINVLPQILAEAYDVLNRLENGI